jgi:uncharacterized membrane protein YfcA
MLPVLILIVLALVVGTLVGCVGIGGVLLPPTLTYVGGFDLHLAMATSMWAFFFTGVAGTATYARRHSVDWRMVSWLGAGTVPAAILGALSNGALPASVLTILLAALIVAAGVNALTKLPSAERSAHSFGAPLLVLIGAIVGFGSALTGTGGPVLLVPILVYLRAPILPAIGVSQVIQIPIALFSTLGYILYGRVDLALGTALGIAMIAGVVIGTRIAHAVPAVALRRIMAAALVGVGFVIIMRVLAG